MLLVHNCDWICLVIIIKLLFVSVLFGHREGGFLFVNDGMNWILVGLFAHHFYRKSLYLSLTFFHFTCYCYIFEGYKRNISITHRLNPHVVNGLTQACNTHDRRAFTACAPMEMFECTCHLHIDALHQRIAVHTAAAAAANTKCLFILISVMLLLV